MANLTPEQLKALNVEKIFDNNEGGITPSNVREVNDAMIDTFSGKELPTNGNYSVLNKGAFVDLFEKGTNELIEQIIDGSDSPTSTSGANPSNAPSVYDLEPDSLAGKTLIEFEFSAYNTTDYVIIGLLPNTTTREYGDNWLCKITPTSLERTRYKLDGSDSRVEINPLMITDGKLTILNPTYLAIGSADTGNAGNNYRYTAGSTNGTRYFNAKDGSVGYADICTKAWFSSYQNTQKYKVEELNKIKSEAFGKNISILGDSISTFEGWIPDSMVARYPLGDVTDVSQTYWKMAIDELGLNLLVNNSWAGTGVVASVSSGTGGTILDTDRTENLHTTENNPDIILVLLGSNDFSALAELGTYDGNTALPDINSRPLTFREGYAVMLQRIANAYPLAKIICGNIVARNYTGETSYPETNSKGNTINEFRNAIIEVAGNLGFEIIGFDKCGITHFNIDATMVDKIHPNVTGMRLLSTELIKRLK